MAVNINVFLKNKYLDFQLEEALKTIDIYSNISNEYQKNLFAILHQEFNRLISFMYKKTNNHFNAEESRKLLSYIKLYEDMEYILKQTDLAFILNENYKSFINLCKTFLVESGGSEIPKNLKHIQLIEYEPIFLLSHSIIIDKKRDEARYPIKLIGSGSYAQVFKYRDEFYDKDIIIKRAKKELNSKEIERFKKEFTVMKQLKSPYVLDVYRYDDEKNEYYAEYADDTIYEYITKNNSKLNDSDRKGLIYQILKSFEYIHSKGYLHRDISLTNVLLIKYDDVIVIKISDFGLVKDEESNLTSLDSDVKGSLNDSNLSVIGFANYTIEYETYALTRLILFIITGKTNINKIDNKKIKEFVLKGVNSDISKRYKNVNEIRNAYNNLYK